MVNKAAGKNVLIGVCGGIAAYKIPSLVSLLVQEGYRVRIVLSEAGARFVSRDTLEVLSGQRVFSSLWDSPENGEDSPVLHINLVDEADVFLLAPASYNWIGKAANGLADDLLSVLFAAWPAGRKPLLFAPAMNPEMWLQVVLQRNIGHLQGLGCELIVPNSGFLACRAEGQGRMVEAEELFFRLESRLRYLVRDGVKDGPTAEGNGFGQAGFASSPRVLEGKKVLLTAGSTYEALDPVRYISNRSSGRTGIALACAARDLGAEVTLILGVEWAIEGISPAERGKAEAQMENSGARAKLQREGGFSRRIPAELFDIRVRPCNSAEQMAQIAAEEFSGCDWALAVAAVCDFRSAQIQNEKIKKEPGQEIYSMEFRLNPDILAYWGQHKRGSKGVSGADVQKVLGFALESGRGEQARQYALKKLYGKKADAIVLNSFSNLEGSTARAQLLLGGEGGEEALEEVEIPLLDKRAFASALLLALAERWN